jgi:formylmethanofuran dehydrogenase subunit E
MSKDYNEIAKYEKAIKEKYGEEAIQNPKKEWTQEKEIAYLEDLKAFHTREVRAKKVEEAEGFTIKEKASSRKVKRDCPVCESYSFSSKDDLYMNKFECCFDCYIQYIEDREERWKSGWRPNK